MGGGWGVIAIAAERDPRGVYRATSRCVRHRGESIDRRDPQFSRRFSVAVSGDMISGKSRMSSSGAHIPHRAARLPRTISALLRLSLSVNSSVLPNSVDCSRSQASASQACSSVGSPYRSPMVTRNRSPESGAGLVVVRACSVDTSEDLSGAT